MNLSLYRRRYWKKRRRFPSCVPVGNFGRRSTLMKCRKRLEKKVRATPRRRVWVPSWTARRCRKRPLSKIARLLLAWVGKNTNTPWCPTLCWNTLKRRSTPPLCTVKVEWQRIECCCEEFCWWPLLLANNVKRCVVRSGRARIYRVVDVLSMLGKVDGRYLVAD